VVLLPYKNLQNSIPIGSDSGKGRSLITLLLTTITVSTILFSSNFAKCAILTHQVIVPDPVKVYILYPPEFKYVGDPVVDTASLSVLEYLMPTIPEPPVPLLRDDPAAVAPPPPPVFTVPAVADCGEVPFVPTPPAPPPPDPPAPMSIVEQPPPPPPKVPPKVDFPAPPFPTGFLVVEFPPAAPAPPPPPPAPTNAPPSKPFPPANPCPEVPAAPAV
jgi:hypothetical protein